MIATSTSWAEAGSAARLFETPELTRGSARGDREEFEVLFQQHSDALRGFLFRRLRSLDDVEDALAMTFYKAWRARETFRGDATDKTWLYRIASRVALDMLRSRRRRSGEQSLEARPLELPDEVEGRSTDPAHAVLDSENEREMHAAVHEAIARLTPTQRRLLSLYYFDGYRYEEISSLLGIPYTKVRGRLHRIRLLLRRDLVDRQRWTLG